MTREHHHQEQIGRVVTSRVYPIFCKSVSLSVSVPTNISEQNALTVKAGLPNENNVHIVTATTL